jgi:hypothetical protein
MMAGCASMRSARAHLFIFLAASACGGFSGQAESSDAGVPEECISLRKPVFTHAELLRKEIQWLNAAYARGAMTEWRNPSEAAEMLSASPVEA